MEKVSLFNPITLKSGLVIKNRFVRAAMSEAMGNGKLSPKKEISHLYSLWDEGEIGLVITGNVMVDANALAEPGNIVFDKNVDMNILKEWAEKGQEKGSRVIVQINHPGRQTPKTICKEPVAPSAIALGERFRKSFNIPRELTNSEVKELVKKFGKAALISKEAGFSGVQIHGAHGYLISQFLSPLSNQRKDEYGGSLENRMRFLKEIYLEIRKEVGNDFTVGLKINSEDFSEGGFNADESIEVIKEMDNLGIDFVEISGGSYENPKMASPTEKGKDNIFFIEHTKRVKKEVSCKVVLTGGIRFVESMKNILDENISDFIGIGRPLAMHVDMIKKIKDGSYSPIETKFVTTGIKSLDKKLGGLLAIVYYQRLMQIYAKGKVPKINTNAWPSLINSMINHGIASLFPQRAR